MLRKIVEEESDVCELDEGRCVCWGETANLGRVILKNRKLGFDALYESGSLRFSKASARCDLCADRSVRGRTNSMEYMI